LGFYVDDFESKIGVNKNVAEELLKKLIKEEKAGILEMQISDSELEILKKALSEVAKEIDKWEFETRIGATLKEVKNLTIFNA